jgi:anti-anti-sigma regulatory factor
MSFHFCSHAWEVQDMTDGTLVRLSSRDFHSDTISVLVDELFEVVQESGQPNLYLDFADIPQIASVVLGKMIALNTRLRAHGGRLILLELQPVPYDAMHAARLADVMEIRVKEAAETIF